MLSNWETAQVAANTALCHEASSPTCISYELMILHFPHLSVDPKYSDQEVSDCQITFLSSLNGHQRLGYGH